MINLKRMCTVGLLMIVFAGTAACAGNKAAASATSNIAIQEQRWNGYIVV